MSESKKYQPTASIKRSKLAPRTVSAKGTKYTVTQYGITKENFLKLCKALKEYGMENIKYINFEVWEASGKADKPADTTPDESADTLPF